MQYTSTSNGAIFKVRLFKNYWIYKKTKVIFVFSIFELCYTGILVKIGEKKNYRTPSGFVAVKIKTTTVISVICVISSSSGQGVGLVQHWLLSKSHQSSKGLIMQGACCAESK